MKYGRIISTLLALAILILAVPGLAQANGLSQPSRPLTSLGTGFTYQGYLEDEGVPAEGEYDFEFSLYDVELNGSPLGTLTLEDQTVTDGYFTVMLDFGAGTFDGGARWLAIGVRPGADTGAYTPLDPRQPLSPAPYAIYAASSPWTGLSGMPAGFADGVDDDTQYTAGNGLVLNGTQLSVDFAGYGTATTVAHSDHTHTNYWRTNGNYQTDPAVNFIGTGDDVALVFRVNNLQALRLEPDATSPNIIGGYSGNSVTEGMYGATIGGGGSDSGLNQVTGSFGTVGGGGNNQAAFACTVGGGFSNNANAQDATVGGGWANEASGSFSTVGGGEFNSASNDTATVGGGNHNTASGDDSTVSGGWSNEASGQYSAVGGGTDNTASGMATVISGGYGNEASGEYATVGGGRSNIAAGDYSFVVGRHAANTNTAHDGVFIFSDGSSLNDFPSTAANQFRVRSTGGAQFVTAIDGSGNPTAGVQLASGGGSWSAMSDVNMKANFAAVDTHTMLEAVVAMPIQTWNYIAQDESIRHIGPMAQDFYAAFGVGEDNTHITTIDADGVALAAIQGLNEIVAEKDAEIAVLQKRVAALEMGRSPLPSTLLSSTFGLLGVLAGVWISRKKGGSK